MGEAKVRLRRGVWVWVLIAIAAIAGVLLFMLRGQIQFALPQDSVKVVLPSGCAVGTDGAAAIIDDSTSRVLWLNADWEVAHILKSGAPDRSFQLANACAFDEQGRLYIRDVIWAENGMSVSKERILRYHTDGSFDKICYARDYENDLQDVSKTKLYGPYRADGRMYLIKIIDNGFEVVDLDHGGTVARYPYEQADFLISDFAVEDAGRTVWLVDKRGAIYYIRSGQPPQLKYQGTGDRIDNASLPWRIDVENARCVFSDIGLYRVSCIEPDGAVTTIVGTGEMYGGPQDKMGMNPILSEARFLPDGSVLSFYDDTLFIKNKAGEVTLRRDALPIGRDLRQIQWIVFTLLVLEIVIFIILSARLMLYVKRNVQVPSSAQISAIILLVIVVTACIIISIMRKAAQDQYLEELFNRIAAISYNADEIIDKQALSRIILPYDYLNEDYLAVKESVERVLDRSRPWNEQLYCNIHKYEQGILYSMFYLDQTIGAFYPQHDDGQIRVLQTGQRMSTDIQEAASGLWMLTCSALHDDNGKIIAVIEIGLDLYSYNQKQQKMLIQVLLSIIVAGVILQLLIVQGVALYSFSAERRKLIAQGRLDREPIGFIRPIVFTVFFAFNMPTAFLPVMSAQFRVSIGALPQEFITALPLSLNLFATAVASFISASLIEKFDARRVGVAGGLLSALSYLGIFLTSNYYAFSAMLILAGAGMGSLLNAVSSYIATVPDEEEKAEGYTIYNSAFFSGANCGTVLGALIASVVGYRGVFIFVGVLLLVPAALILKLMRRGAGARKNITDLQEVLPHKKADMGLLRFVTTPVILVFLVLCYMPYMISGHFLYYFIPSYGSAIGLNETAVSQVLLVNGVCVLLMSQAASWVLGKRRAYHIQVAVALVVLSGAFLCYARHTQSIGTVLLTVIIMSAANSFGASAMNMYFNSREQTIRYGQGKATGVFSLAENIGDTAGPFVFSYIMSGSIMAGFFMLAAFYVGCAAVFLTVNRLSSMRLKKRLPE